MIDNQMASLPTDILDQLMYNYPDSLALTCQHYYHFVTMTRKIQRWYRSWRLLPEKYFPEKSCTERPDQRLQRWERNSCSV